MACRIEHHIICVEDVAQPVNVFHTLSLVVEAFVCCVVVEPNFPVSHDVADGHKVIHAIDERVAYKQHLGLAMGAVGLYSNV